MPFVVLLPLMLAPDAQVDQWTQWKIETVDSEGGNSGNSIAIDSLGAVHISYFDHTDISTSPTVRKDDLKYATNASGSWVTETVETSGDGFVKTGLYSSIAIDSSDQVHIIYYETEMVIGGPHRREVKYATNASGSWTTDSVYSDAPSGYYLHTSIALDSLDNIHAAFRGEDPGQYTPRFYYATNASGSWALEDMGIGGYASVAIDSHDKVHISFGGDVTVRPPALAGIRYATNASGTWEIENVTGNEAWPEHSSIALDSNDKVHIAFSNLATTSVLRYSNNVSGSWVSETVDVGWVGGSDITIAIDSDDKVHIGCSRASYGPPVLDRDLSHVTNVSGSWKFETVDDLGGGILGEYSSIALDSSDNVHFSYYDSTTDTLKYAHSAPTPVPASGVWSLIACGGVLVSAGCRVLRRRRNCG
jgi:hypothetical protein